MSHIEFLIIYMNLQLYFMLIGAKEMKIKIINLLKMEKLKIRNFNQLFLVSIVIQRGMSILGVSLPRKNVMNKIVKFFFLIIIILFFFNIFNYYSSNKNIKNINLNEIKYR